MPMQPTIDEMECLSLDLDDVEQISRVARALSVPKRVEILRLLGEKNIMSVNEIALSLDLPISSASMHIGVLEEADLVYCERMSSIHGSMKMCTRRKSSVYFRLRAEPAPSAKQFSQALPMGAYSRAADIEEPCGLASQVGPIGVYNNPRSFYLPERLDAQILWFKSGRLDYQFSLLLHENIDIEYLELSFEACTQAQLQDPVWKTEINVSINDCPLGSGICSCDNQGRRGTFNPSWWPDVATQHGELQTWRVTSGGSFLQGQRVSDVTLNDLRLTERPCVDVSILVPRDSQYQAGVNLFGTGFGDYNQALHLLIGYQRN